MYACIYGSLIPNHQVQVHQYLSNCNFQPYCQIYFFQLHSIMTFHLLIISRRMRTVCWQRTRREEEMESWRLMSSQFNQSRPSVAGIHNLPYTYTYTYMYMTIIQLIWTGAIIFTLTVLITIERVQFKKMHCTCIWNVVKWLPAFVKSAFVKLVPHFIEYAMLFYIQSCIWMSLGKFAIKTPPYGWKFYTREP